MSPAGTWSSSWLVSVGVFPILQFENVDLLLFKVDGVEKPVVANSIAEYGLQVSLESLYVWPETRVKPQSGIDFFYDLFVVAPVVTGFYSFEEGSRLCDCELIG